MFGLYLKSVLCGGGQYGVGRAGALFLSISRYSVGTMVYAPLPCVAYAVYAFVQTTSRRSNCVLLAITLVRQPAVTARSRRG